MSSKPKVRLKDIAERAEISVAAVSMALSDHPDISVETKQRVRQISRDLGYRRRRSAGAARNGGPGRITERFGFLLLGSRLEDEVYAGMLRELTVLASSLGSRVEVSAIEDISDPHLTAERALTYARGLDGLLLMGHIEKHLLEEITAADIPYVVIGHTMVGPDEMPRGRAQIVASNDIAMGQLATRCLVDAGHKRIGFVCEQLPRGLSHSRWLGGYCAGHIEARLPVDEDLTFVAGQLHSDGSAAAEHMLNLADRPTAYVVPDARIAAFFMQAMRARGAEVDPKAIVIGGQLYVAQRYGLSDYPLILDNLGQLAEVGLRQLTELCHDSMLTCAEVLVPFRWRNLPGRPDPVVPDLAAASEV